MLAAFDALQNVERAVGLDFQFIHAEKHVANAEALGNALHGDACTT